MWQLVLFRDSPIFAWCPPEVAIDDNLKIGIMEAGKVWAQIEPGGFYYALTLLE